MTRARISRSSLATLRERVSPWMLTLVLGSLSVYEIFVGDFFGKSPVAPKLVMAVEAVFVTVPLRWRKESPNAVLGSWSLAGSSAGPSRAGRAVLLAPRRGSRG